MAKKTEADTQFSFKDLALLVTYTTNELYGVQSRELVSRKRI